MDYYLNEENCYNRLLTEYEKYGTLIIAVDFDGTISDFHKEGLLFNDVITLLKDCNELGLRLVIYTANNDYQLIRKECKHLGIIIEGINKQLLEEFKDIVKLYYNILIDDRAGLSSSYKILRRLVDEKIILEKLSKFMHEECWIKFAKGIYQEENLTEERKVRWSKLFIPYEELEEDEKEKDRIFARKLMEVLK